MKRVRRAGAQTGPDRSGAYRSELPHGDAGGGPPTSGPDGRAADLTEDALKWPTLVSEAKEQVRDTRELVEAHGEPSEEERLNRIVADVEEAIEG